MQHIELCISCYFREFDEYTYGKPWKKQNSEKAGGYSAWVIHSCFLSTKSVQTATFARHKQTQTPSSFHWKTYSSQRNIHLVNTKHCFLLCCSTPAVNICDREHICKLRIFWSPQTGQVNCYVIKILSKLLGAVFLYRAKATPKLEATSKWLDDTHDKKCH